MELDYSGNGTSMNQHCQDSVVLNTQLDRSSDGINMDEPATILAAPTVYTGAIFHVEDRDVALHRYDGTDTVVHRQVVVHAPAVVMLVQDTYTGKYLIEREYRAGSAHFAYGLPAGLMDEGEDPRTAALRELAEETGVYATADDVEFDHVGDCYSTEGMSDELAHIYIVRVHHWQPHSTQFDADEHVESAWVSWDELQALPINASNSVIAIQAEMIRRLQKEKEFV